MQFKVDVKGRLKTVEEFENIIVRSDANGNILRLKDIARIELGAESYSSNSKFNGKSSAGLGVFRSTDANAIETIEGVKAELARLEKSFPPGVTWSTAYDPTKFIIISMEEIVVTLVSALLLVVIITYLFLQDWRATIIPSLAIPISLVGTFTAIYALGYSINLLTMFGLILGNRISWTMRLW
ncbi:MAG: efflux RND transporter permease subunit [Bacilli bacterium]